MPLILGTNSIKDTTYEVANSCRFNAADSAELTLTPTAGNQKTWTFSCWVKRSTVGVTDGTYSIFEAGHGSTPWFIAAFNNDAIHIAATAGSSASWETAAVFRDVAAWYHVVLVLDTTSATSSISSGSTDRIRVFVNGVQQALSGGTVPTQNADLQFNSNVGHHLFGASYGQFFPGYVAEVFFIDGSALAPTAFGEFDEDSPDIWKPKDCKDDLTFGSEGYYLDFADSGNLGDDESGNGNDWTEANLAATDQCVDSPTNNFATYDASLGLGGTLAEGNCQYQTGSSYANSNTAFSSIGINKGKWYAEFLVTASSSGNSVIGAGYDPEIQQDGRSNFCQEIDEGWGYAENGYAYNNGSTDLGTTYTTNDIVGVALDLDNDKIYWYKNNTLINSGGTAIDADKLYFFGVSDTTSGGQTTVQANFGNPPTALSSAANDENGYGSFEYAPPSGYLALCTKNLAEEG